MFMLACMGLGDAHMEAVIGKNNGGEITHAHTVVNPGLCRRIFNFMGCQ